MAACIILMASKREADSSSSPEDTDTHIDYNFVIALSIILFLALVAIAWYLRLRFARKRRVDLDQQLQAGEGHFDSAMGMVTWNRQCGSCGGEETERARTGSLFKLKSVMVRKDSVAMSSSRGSPGTGEVEGERQKRKWPGLSQWRTQDSRSSTLGPNAFTILDTTVPLTSTERPSPTHSRRQSCKGFFDPLTLHNPLHHVPAQRRSSSVSRDTYHKRWWNEAALRGSTTSPIRQSPVLEVVPEPGVRGHAGDTRDAGGSSAVSKDHGRRSTGSAHASWKGSRCASVMYDWTRPTDAEVHARNEMNFGDIIWDGPRGTAASNAKVQDEHVQSTDWAFKM